MRKERHEEEKTVLSSEIEGLEAELEAAEAEAPVRSKSEFKRIERKEKNYAYN